MILRRRHRAPRNPRRERPGAFATKITNPRGVIAAITIVITVIAAVIGVGGTVFSWFDSLDQPGSNDVAVRFTSLTDGRDFKQSNNFRMPFGATLPTPAGTGYCGDDVQDSLLKNGQLAGGFVRLTLENTYMGPNGGGLQVEQIRAVVRTADRPTDGAIVSCENSGGDMPITAKIKAEDGAWARLMDDSGQPLVSFVLDRGEQQLINLVLEPSLMDVSVDLFADFVSAGESFSVQVNTEPIKVASMEGTSPFRIRPKGSDHGIGAGYWCEIDGGPPSICSGNRVFTRAEESAALGGVTATEVLEVTPINTDGTLAEGFIALDHKEGVDCIRLESNSLDTANSVLVYKCHAKGEQLKLCWARTGDPKVVCGRDPAGRTVDRYELATKPFDNPATASAAIPWWLKLADGTQCSSILEDVRPSRKDNYKPLYACDRGGEYILGLNDEPPIDASRSIWIVKIGGASATPEQQPPPRAVAVVAAFFTGHER